MKLILLIFLVKVPLESPAQTLTPQVVNISGIDFNKNLEYYSFSLGESFVNTLESGLIITQGFLQPKHFVPCAEFVLTVYPNPTTDVINFRFEGCDGKVQKITVLDIFGKILFDDFIPTNRADLSELKTGIYLIKVFNAKGKALGIAKIAKVNRL